MDFTGLMPRFPNDRPLTAFEREHRLLQKKRLDVPLLAQLCVVKMNAGSLLSVDRWYAWRGFVALLGAIGVAFGVGGILMLAWILVVGELPNENGLWEAIFIGMGMCAALVPPAPGSLARRCSAGPTTPSPWIASAAWCTSSGWTALC